LTITIIGNGNSEEVQHSGANVHDAHLVCVDFPITKEDPRHVRRVDAVVSAPALFVVLKNFLGYGSGGTSTGDTIPRLKPHHLIRGFFHIGTLVDFPCVIHLPYSVKGPLFIIELAQPLDDLPL
jgi:hypothetical protein